MPRATPTRRPGLPRPGSDDVAASIATIIHLHGLARPSRTRHAVPAAAWELNRGRPTPGWPPGRVGVNAATIQARQEVNNRRIATLVMPRRLGRLPGSLQLRQQPT